MGRSLIGELALNWEKNTRGKSVESTMNFIHLLMSCVVRYLVFFEQNVVRTYEYIVQYKSTVLYDIFCKDVHI